MCGSRFARQGGGEGCGKASVRKKNSAVNNVFGVRVLEDRTITYKACSTICWYVEPDLIKLILR